jgi:hypothetical protein
MHQVTGDISDHGFKSVWYIYSREVVCPDLELGVFVLYAPTLRCGILNNHATIYICIGKVFLVQTVEALRVARG